MKGRVQHTSLHFRYLFAKCVSSIVIKMVGERSQLARQPRVDSQLILEKSFHG